MLTAPGANITNAVAPLTASGGTSFAQGLTAANTILAYEKDAPTKGGLCLFGDASVRKLTAEEFKQAPKAGKK